MASGLPQIEISKEPLIYFLLHSTLFVAGLGASFFALGLWFGWLTWARHKRRVRELQEENDHLKHDVAALKRRVAEQNVRGIRPSSSEGTTATVPQPQPDPGPLLPWGDTEIVITPFVLPPPSKSVLTVPDEGAESPEETQSLDPIPPTIPSNGHHLPSVEEANRSPEVHTLSGTHAPPMAAVLAVSDPLLGLVFEERPAVVDDLTKLKGVAAVLERRLHQNGIYTYRQIALWNDRNIREFSSRLAFKDRIARERWVEQARELHLQHHGESL